MNSPLSLKKPHVENVGIVAGYVYMYTGPADLQIMQIQ
jgi:hypothetical protein